MGRSVFDIANELVAHHADRPEFQSVCLDDGTDEPEWIVIVARGETARYVRDIYHERVGDRTDDLGAEWPECRATSWQLEGHAICRGPAGHDGGHVWEVQ